jgi:hypothetical protein
MLTTMLDGHDDLLWNAFVNAMLAAGPADERRSRYGEKPALYVRDREVAHLEAPGVIDLRITRQGWSLVKAQYADDPAVCRGRSRRDWIELHLSSLGDLDRLSTLVDTAMAENA